jgi:hypothetical protein
MTVATRLLITLVAAVLVFILLYLFTSFVLWDRHWMDDIAGWGKDTRVMFLIFYGVLPLYVGFGVGFFPTYRK